MMDESIHVRPAVETDAEQLQQLLANITAERLPVLFRRHSVPTVDEERMFIRNFLSTPRSLLLVAESGGEVVGTLDFHGHSRPQQDHAGEFGMSVARPWRGKGVGKQLLEHLFKWAPTRNIRRIELRVFSNNPAAIGLYKSVGFVIEGRQVEAVQVDGEYVDIIFMAKLH